MTPKSPPFPEDEQLFDDLSISGTNFSCRNTTLPPTLPGQPTLTLTDLSLADFLKEDLLTSDLDRMATHLWLVATPSHSHISPLHHQIVRGRNIVVTENPELHLVWINSRVFIKPLPLYLLSHAIWVGCLSGVYTSGISPEDAQRLESAGLGYLRTWYYLVRHKSDFRIAQEHHLIPEAVSWPHFLRFIHRFARISDVEVSGRYQYGDLRLSRLNMWAQVFLHRWKFHKAHGQYADYFAHFYGPLLFAFAVFSTTLNAMQVVLASGDVWTSFIRTSKWVSVVTLFFVTLICGYLLAVWSFMVFREAIFALNQRTKRKPAATSI